LKPRDGVLAFSLQFFLESTQLHVRRAAGAAAENFLVRHRSVGPKDFFDIALTTH
jgi:hypothetical protein